MTAITYLSVLLGKRIDWHTNKLNEYQLVTLSRIITALAAGLLLLLLLFLPFLSVVPLAFFSLLFLTPPDSSTLTPTYPSPHSHSIPAIVPSPIRTFP
jgi:hypothetical protein